MKKKPSDRKKRPRFRLSCQDWPLDNHPESPTHKTGFRPVSDQFQPSFKIVSDQFQSETGLKLLKQVLN